VLGNWRRGNKKELEISRRQIGMEEMNQSFEVKSNET